MRRLLVSVSILMSSVAWGQSADPAAAVRAACRSDSEAPQRIEIPTPALDWRDGALTADLGTSISLDSGAVVLFPVAGEEESGLQPAPMPAEQGAVFVRARANDRLVARLDFTLAAGAVAGPSCLSLAGGRILRVRYRPIRLELFDLGTDEGRARKRPALVLKTTAVIEAERATPAVQLGPAALRRADEGSRAPLERGLAALEPALRRCYADALARRRDLAGRLVLGLVIDRGRLSVERVEIDSLGDAPLSSCARAVIEGAPAPSGARLSAFSLPIGFLRR